MPIFCVINKDLRAYTGNGSTIEIIKCILTSHSFHLVLMYRFGCLLAKMPILGSLFRVIIEYLIRIVFASDISLRSEIGEGVMIVHGHDIVIGGDVRIGRNCKILNGVTLGNKDTESSINQQPVLGDNVVIGSGAKLLGAIKIGNNVIIGANSVVLRDIPPNVVIAGIPAKIIKYK